MNPSTIILLGIAEMGCISSTSPYL